MLELRELRNNVAYGQHNPTAGEALTYLQSAQELMGTAAQVSGYVSAQLESDRLRNDDPRRIMTWGRRMRGDVRELRPPAVLLLDLLAAAELR